MRPEAATGLVWVRAEPEHTGQAQGGWKLRLLINTQQGASVSHPPGALQGKLHQPVLRVGSPLRSGLVQAVVQGVLR